jgi:hypothetical protein
MGISESVLLMFILIGFLALLLRVARNKWLNHFESYRRKLLTSTTKLAPMRSGKMPWRS